jgi:exodeoxyribonuclease V alpha subunit
MAVMIAPNPATTAPYQLTLEITGVRYRADDFAVLSALSDEGEEVTVVGPLAHVQEGESIEVAGAWRRHPKHGAQLHAERVRVRAPTGEAALLG